MQRRMMAMLALMTMMALSMAVGPRAASAAAALPLFDRTCKVAGVGTTRCGPVVTLQAGRCLTINTDWTSLGYPVVYYAYDNSTNVLVSQTTDQYARSRYTIKCAGTRAIDLYLVVDSRSYTAAQDIQFDMLN